MIINRYQKRIFKDLSALSKLNLNQFKRKRRKEGDYVAILEAELVEKNS